MTHTKKHTSPTYSRLKEPLFSISLHSNIPPFRAYVVNAPFSHKINIKTIRARRAANRLADIRDKRALCPTKLCFVLCRVYSRFVLYNVWRGVHTHFTKV